MANDSSEETKEVAQLIRNGDYFSDACAWYQTVYIRQIADRAFFLLIGISALLIGGIAILAFFDLLPIVDHHPTLIANPRIDTQQLSIRPLKEKNESIDAAMQRFFITSYIEKRESYRLRGGDLAKAFVAAHSDPVSLQAYLNEISPQNPKSIAAMVGQGNERIAIAGEIEVNEKVEPHVAQANYWVYDIVNGQFVRTQHRATMGFYFTPVGVKEVVDKDTGETIIQTEEPQFQVVQYEHN